MTRSNWNSGIGPFWKSWCRTLTWTFFWRIWWMWVAKDMLPLMGMDYTTLRVYRYTTFTCITTHSSITCVTGTLLCHPNDRYRTMLCSDFGDRDGCTLWGEVRRRRGGVGDAHGRFWWRQRPTHHRHLARAHQLICMRAQLFISTSSVSLSHQTFTLIFSYQLNIVRLVWPINNCFKISNSMEKYIGSVFWNHATINLVLFLSSLEF